MAIGTVSEHIIIIFHNPVKIAEFHEVNKNAYFENLLECKPVVNVWVFLFLMKA